jgi:hypothetical protein
MATPTFGAVKSVVCDAELNPAIVALGPFTKKVEAFPEVEYHQYR